MALSPDEAKVLAMLIVVVSAAGFGAKLLQPLARGLGKRLEGGSPGELEELRERVRDLEGHEARIQELEERLEFTERLLSQKETARLADPEQR